MSWTYVNGAGANAGASSTTIAVNVGSVQVGDLAVVWTTHEDTAATIAASDGASTFVQDPDGVKNNPQALGEPHSCMLYTLSSGASGTVTYTVTFGAGKPFRNIVVQVWRPTATPTFEDSASGAATSGTAANSGNITTAGTDGLAFGANAEYGSAVGTPLINGAAPDQTTSTGNTSLWSKTYSAGFTGAASGTLTFTNAWNCTAMAFKIGSAAALPKRPKAIMQAVNRASTY